MQKNHPPFRSGYIAIIGRPNVGKSTLLNQLLGQKLSITSRKPQTTRHQILGIKTTDDYQMVFVDTPGLHKEGHGALNRYMNRAASSVVFDVDLVLFMVDGLQWTEDDAFALQKIAKTEAPVILIVNKVDKIGEKKKLLPHLKTLSAKYNFAKTIPLSAKNPEDAHMLASILVEYLPEQAAIFPKDQISDRNERFFAAEIIREKLMRKLGQELPYALTVEIEQFKTEKGILRISAVIYVEKSGQKNIVIGEKGQKLKEVGQAARLDMQKFFDEKVFLQLWVKVKRGWSDNERSLQSLGYKS